MTENNRMRLMQLCTLCSQGEMSPSEHEELQAVLRHDPHARQVWFEFQDQELALRKLVLLPSFAQASLESDAFYTEPVGQGSCAQAQRVDSQFKSSKAKLWFAIAAVVAFICVSATILFSLESKRGPLGTIAARPSVANGLIREIALKSPTDGSTLTIAGQTNKFIVLHFLLKTECPFCLKHTYEYARLAESTPDILHVFLKPDENGEILEWAQKVRKAGLNSAPVIYRDPDASLAKELGIPDGFVFHGESMHYPALVLLDGSGRELFRYVGKDNTDRMPTGRFNEELAAIASQHSSSIHN